MNYSAIFSDAHKQAKALMTTGFYASYRGAFSVALSAILRQEWAAFKAEKVEEEKAKESLAPVKKPVSRSNQEKRAASGRGLIYGRRVAKARFWGESLRNENKDRVVFH